MGKLKFIETGQWHSRYSWLMITFVDVNISFKLGLFLLITMWSQLSPQQNIAFHENIIVE